MIACFQETVCEWISLYKRVPSHVGDLEKELAGHSFGSSSYFSSDIELCCFIKLFFDLPSCQLNKSNNAQLQQLQPHWSGRLRRCPLALDLSHWSCRPHRCTLALDLPHWSGRPRRCLLILGLLHWSGRSCRCLLALDLPHWCRRPRRCTLALDLLHPWRASSTCATVFRPLTQHSPCNHRLRNMRFCRTGIHQAGFHGCIHARAYLSHKLVSEYPDLQTLFSSLAPLPWPEGHGSIQMGTRVPLTQIG